VGKQKLNQIISGIKARDHQTLSNLYRDYYPKVLGYIMSKGGGGDDAKDVFQEAIIVIYKQIENKQLEIKQDFGSFIIGIAKRLWLKHLRANDIHSRFVQQLNPQKTEDHPSDVELENEMELYLIRKYILKLGVDCRNILMWSAEGITNEEIAVKMKYKSEKTVRTKKYKCKSTLIGMIKNDPNSK
jgi:RNA polymerase sigma factor (sigma-70 family)